MNSIGGFLVLLLIASQTEARSPEETGTREHNALAHAADEGAKGWRRKAEVSDALADSLVRQFKLLLYLPSVSPSEPQLREQILFRLLEESAIRSYNVTAMVSVLSDEGVTALLEYMMNLLSSTETMSNFVFSVFGVVDDKVLLQAITNLTAASQALVGLDAFIERLKSLNALNGTILVSVASSYNEIAKRLYYSGASMKYAHSVDNKIPGCLTLLFKIQPVVLVNSRFYETATEKGDGSQDDPAASKWDHQWDGEEMTFKNQLGLYLGGKKAWIPEPSGYDCLLKTVDTNEYLYMRTGSGGNELYLGRFKNDSSDSQWSVRDIV